MGLQDSVSWYQKKIGTYDKQQWEKTVEQRILHGLTHVLKKTAKLKTDLIDVDLVRGSSFPKAKPKHGIITVTKLAFIRWLFLPLYSYWWIQQTCLSIFGILLLLYILQFCNMIIYFSCQDDQLLEHVSAYEILVPAAMMLILSIIHSQIVSTNSGSSQDLLKSRSKRTRRTKRRGTNTRFTFDCKLDSYSGKGSVPSNICYMKGAKRTEENTVRRRNIVWCNPLQNLSGEPDLISQEPVQDPEIRSRENTPAEDDGFESLNSNGSSENGEENQDNVINERGSSDEETNPAHRSNYNKKINFVLDDNVNRLNRQREGENSNTESNGALNKCNDNCSVTELYKLENCLNESYFTIVKNNNEEVAESSNDRDAWVREVLNKRDESLPNLCRRQSAPGLCSTCEVCDHDTDHKDTDSDGSNKKVRTKKSTSPQRLLHRRRGSLTLQANIARSSSYNSSCESDDGDRYDNVHLTEGTTSAAEWIGITTNSEECSVTSEVDESEGPNGSKILDDHPFAWEFQLSPSSIMSPSCAASDKVSCTIWENKDVKRADLSVLDISSAIIARVETMHENMDYFYAGLCVALVISLVPSFCRIIEITHENGAAATGDSANPHSILIEPVLSLTAVDLTDGFFEKAYQYIPVVFDVAFGSTLIERLVIFTALFERFVLAALFFFLVAVAERTFKQRFLYAKFFSRLTSFRRARKSELPHFRLNKVRNIKTWLSVRSYLKKRGPQRSVDVIVSAAFIITLLLLSFLSVELLKDNWDDADMNSPPKMIPLEKKNFDSVRLHSEYNLEALVWCLVLGVYLLRFMTLGNKTNRKYRNLSVLLTEQINLYLQIEQKPNKKEELMVANSVLKLAADLLKELESPFKISGLSANPYVYTITKVVILSALSGVLSEMLGFKLKLHKIKIK